MSAMEMSAFNGFLGVNVHLNFTGTAYTNTTNVANALNYLGITNMRDKAAQSSSAYDTMASKGYHFDFFAPGGSEQMDMNTLISKLHTFAVNHPGSIISIEGPNEINGWPVTWNGATGMGAGVQFETALYNGLTADSVLNPIPLINLSLAADSLSTYSGLGNMASISDRGNAHIYMSYGNQPNVQFNTLLSYAQTVTPGDKMAVTEAGYGTLSTDTNLGVDLVTQAKLTLNLIMDAAKAGVTNLYLYELYDDQYSGGGAWNSFGLYNADNTPKLAATAIHNLTTVLNTGVGDTMAEPIYTVAGLSGFHDNLTMHEANGTYDIIIWGEPDIWDQTNHRPITAATQTATINLASAVGSYSVYDPMVGTAPIATGSNTSQIKVNVTDHPLIIELHGGAVVTPPPPPPPHVDPTVAISGSVTHLEGDSGTTAFTYTVTRTGDLSLASTVDWTVLDGTATKANDLTGVFSGTLSFAAGEATKLITISAVGDTVVENDETFTVSLSGATGATLGTATATGVITNDDAVVVTPPPPPPPPTTTTITGTDAANTINGGSAAELIDAKGGNDIVYAGAGNDTIIGGAGNDKLYGKEGADVLTGGLGQDHFEFDVSWTTGVDTITDFNPRDDTIYLFDEVFKGLKVGTLTNQAFYTGTAAHDSSDRIIYDKAHGDLYFDPDGTGSAAKVLFAHITPGTGLTNGDFVVI